MDRTNATQGTSSGQPTGADSEECKRLQAVIEKLQTELGVSDTIRPYIFS